MEIDRCVFDTVVGELVLNSLHDITLDIELVVVGETIHFVNEDLDVDIRVGRLEIENGTVEAIDGFQVFVLGVDDPY